MTVLPTFQWHGARPRLLDLERYEQGWAVALILQREGDCRLIPLAWLYEQPLPDDDRFPPGWPLETDAIHEPTLNQTLQEWQREGWELRGRIELQFIGLDTDPNFWPTIHTHLWQNQTDERQGIKDK
jgi:hypothetical protein